MTEQQALRYLILITRMTMMIMKMVKESHKQKLKKSMTKLDNMAKERPTLNPALVIFLNIDTRGGHNGCDK